MYIVYILFSPANEKIYTGHTTDLIKRFHFHNTHGRQLATSPYRPWEVIYVEVFEDKVAAMRREWLLKSGKGRVWIWGKIRQEYYTKRFISNDND